MNMAPTNLLLEMLQAPLKKLLFQLLEPVALPAGKVLYAPDRPPVYVHFLTSGVASIVTYMADGEASEQAVVGSEGTPEVMYLLGAGAGLTTCFMQIDSTALRIKFKDLEQLFDEEGDIRRVLLRFVQYRAIILGQMAACNRFHEVEQRLALWLLMVGDRIADAGIDITQELLATMLGTRRSTVSVLAGKMQRDGLIEYSRGSIHILDRTGLESVACECYPVCRTALNRLRGFAPSAPQHHSSSNGLKHSVA